MENCLAIITARGGSKRIPRKNMKSFLGKPIIQYSIESAQSSGCFSEIMVSTDDYGIADFSKSKGASIPFFRSSNTSGDFSTTADVIKEVLLQYQQINKKFDYCCCIYPTAPFITGDRLRTAFSMLKEKQADSVVPVVRFSFPIFRSFKIEDGLVKMNWPEHMNTRSQDMIPAFHDCGQFYFLSVEKFLQTNRLFSDFTIPLEMPESEVQDIDNEEDWKLAEIKYSFLLSKI
jgi:N-acylneuraminate cytidylyltransferase